MLAYCAALMNGAWCPLNDKEFDVQYLRAITGGKTKRQALAMSLRGLSFVVGTSPACLASAPFGNEPHDWNEQANGSILGGAG